MATVDEADKHAKIQRFNQAFAEGVPHNRALGLRLLDFEAKPEQGWGQAVLCLPYHEQLVGDPDSGVLHGGAVTSLVDATCGAAVFVALAHPQRIATLDLRIDYLRPATVGTELRARATCYKLTRSIAFVRADAHHDDDSGPVATAAATFMIFRDRPSSLASKGRAS